MRYSQWTIARAMLAWVIGLTAARTMAAQAASHEQAPAASAPQQLWDGQNDATDPRLPASSPYASFGRYAYTEECARAALWNENMVWATRRRDSVARARYGNPLDSSAVAAGERCLAHFSAPLTTARDLLGLGAAYLAVNDDSAAATAFARAEHDAASLPPVRRAWIKTFMVELYLTAPRARIAAAAAVQRQLDALGATAAIPQMMAHLSMARAGQRADSVALWEHEAQAAIATIRRATPEERREYAFEGADGYWLLMRVRLRNNDMPGALAAVDSLQRDLLPVQQYLNGRVHYMKAWIGKQGTPAPPIRATRWGNLSSPADTIHPAPGRVSIVLFAVPQCRHLICAEQYSMIRRLTEQFGSSLDVVVMVRTRGFYGRRLVTPDSEVTLIHHYFVDQLHLPARISIWKTETRRRDDEAVEAVDVPNEKAYPLPYSDNPVAEMIGPDGKWRMLLDFMPASEVLIADLIREELAKE